MWSEEVVVQRIELYLDILLQLSDRSKVAVVAHELAHAWLNDNVRPEQSKRREMESDELARKWGFGVELDALAKETSSAFDERASGNGPFRSLPTQDRRRDRQGFHDGRGGAWPPWRGRTT